MIIVYKRKKRDQSLTKKKKVVEIYHQLKKTVFWVVLFKEERTKKDVTGFKGFLCFKKTNMLR